MLKGGLPMIGRIAGLPASALDALGSDAYRSHLATLADLDREVTKARQELADRVYEIIPQASPELRPRLLAIRRDCFNGRRLAKFGAADEIRRWCGEGYDRIAVLEARLEEAMASWEKEFVRCRGEQRHHLIGFLEDRNLLRGLALAAPELIANVQRLRKPFESYGRKEKGLETSLLRYLSRAACKTSPYSTLGRLAFAATRDDDPPTGLELAGSSWIQRPSLRIKRFLIDQNVDLLCRLPAFRRGLQIVVNDTAETGTDGAWRFLRPGFWTVDAKDGNLNYLQDAIVKVRFGGPLVAWLGEELPRRKILYGDLGGETGKGLLAEAFPEDDAGQLQSFVDKLLEIGFLCLLKPWPANAPRAELHLADYLRQAEPLGELGGMADLVDRIVALEDSYAATGSPLEVIAELKGKLAELWRVNLQAAGLDPEIENGLVGKGNFYEDVFLFPAGAAAASERSGGSRAGRKPAEDAVVGASARQIGSALGHLEPLARLSDLYNRRYDFLHAVDAFMERHWPGARAVKFLDLFQKGQGLWEEFVEFQAETRRGFRESRWKETFRPGDSRAAAALGELREAVWDGVESAVARIDEMTFISSGKLAAMTAPIPAQYRPIGVCLFLQKAEPPGDLWVLNRIYEGIGRFGSRYTSVMGEESSRGYASHLEARGTIEQDGAAAVLLDLMRIQGDTLNIHAVQTPRILANPGEWIDVEPSRNVRLRELEVRRDSSTGLPRLVDASGQWYLPVHLGGASHLYAPLALRFLSAFGPGEFRLVAPARLARETGTLREWKRLIIGNVVLNRRKWGFPPEELRAEIAGLGDAAAFLAVNRWRIAKGIPEKVFLIEGFNHKHLGLHFKPQFIDFGSPLFMSIFRAALAESEAPLLAVEEALPDPAAAPRDASGVPWTVELMIDSLAFREPRKLKTNDLRQSADCRQEPSPITA